MTIDELRESIDMLDGRILSLLNERMEKALLTKAFKQEVQDTAREKAVMDRVSRSSRCLVTPEFSTDLYARILAESRAIQAGRKKTVGFQGEHGAYSEVAARSLMPDAATIPCREFVDVFEAVKDGVIDYGIVPVENTLGGIIGPVNSILAYTDLRIVAAVDMPVQHCLLAPAGTDYRDIRTVASHSQALAQCRRFLARNNLDAEPYYDTAGAARMLSQEKTKGMAAIASKFAAEIYDLEIIKEGIQDSDSNRTRFFVMARESAVKDGNKCSAVFYTEDKAGSLFGTLEIFAKASINLTRIESVPDKPGDYAIFMDFEGSDSDANVKRAIEEAMKVTREFRILGCYRETRL